MLARLAAVPDLTLRALVVELGERGVVTSYGSVWRIVHDAGILGMRLGVSRPLQAEQNRRVVSTMSTRKSLDSLQRANIFHEIEALFGQQLRSLYKVELPVSASLAALLEQIIRGEGNSGAERKGDSKLE